MKTILVILLLFSILSYSQDKYIEEASLECIYEAYFETNVDIKRELIDYEKFLIKHKFLNDNTGKSYIIFLKKVYKIKAVPATRPDSLFWKIVKSKFLNNDRKDCILKKLMVRGHFKSIANIENSKVYKVINKLDSRPEDSQDVFKHFAHNILTTLNEKDLEKPYYKTMILMLIAVSSNMEGHTRFTPFPSPEFYDKKKDTVH
ncbi:hypothetical protein [Aquimarina aggregata]|uniref:hypothetical protein n=1 Tax=Aquimarina aggregata TaxID=1642818 RepID=UPI002491095F|nr:hypothetical protein [Aquimarina aggregata]